MGRQGRAKSASRLTLTYTFEMTLCCLLRYRRIAFLESDRTVGLMIIYVKDKLTMN